jgi:hypothetical protein
MEQMVTTIAAVVDTVEEKFEPFYDKYVSSVIFLALKKICFNIFKFY